jgi:hypothetical protein
MRMQMRRFTRLTNGFSKTLENHAHAVGTHFVHYNFCRIHRTLDHHRRYCDGLAEDVLLEPSGSPTEPRVPLRSYQ